MNWKDLEMELLELESIELERIVAEKINSIMGFKVVEFLGQGQSGKVYKCVRSESGIIYESAVKAIIIPEKIKLFSDKNIGFSKDMVRRSLVEIEALIKLKSSPNIIAIEEYECDFLPDGRVIILIRMELAKKVIFDEILCFNRQKRIEILLDIGKGIMDCEENGIIHGDIKPNNLFIAGNGKYKLGDFGISKIGSNEENRDGSAGEFSENRGTPGFCTPELWRNGIRDRSTDIYSIGILGFMLFNNGMPPFLRMEEKDKPMAKEKAFKKRVNGTKIPFPIHGGVELSRIIMKTMEFLPENRYSGSKEFCEEVKRLLKTEYEFHGHDEYEHNENFEPEYIVPEYAVPEYIVPEYSVPEYTAKAAEYIDFECNMGNYWNGNFVCKKGEIFLISDLVSGGLYSTTKCRKLHLLSKDYFISLKNIGNDLYSLNSNGESVKTEFTKNKITMQSKINIGENYTNLIITDKTMLDLGSKCFRPVRHKDLIFHGGTSEDSGLYCTSSVSGSSYKLLETEMRTFNVFRNQLITADYDGMIKIYNLSDLEELFYRRNKGEVGSVNKNTKESVSGTNIEFICCVSGKIFMQSISGECYIYESGTLLELNASVLEPIT